MSLRRSAETPANWRAASLSIKSAYVLSASSYSRTTPGFVRSTKLSDRATVAALCERRFSWNQRNTAGHRPPLQHSKANPKKSLKTECSGDDIERGGLQKFSRQRTRSYSIGAL